MTAFKIFLLFGAVLYGLPGLVWWVNHRRAKRARDARPSVAMDAPTS